jgi:chemotaxis protein histidine kinase CheA
MRFSGTSLVSPLQNASAFKSDKPAGALKVGTPSSGVMVCGLEPHVDERTLTLAITPIAPVKDLRLVRQKHSLQSRCFAFCDLFSTSDATNVLNTLNGAQIESQETPLRILFTRDGQQAGRYQEDKNHPDDDAAAAANETEELKEQDTEQPRHALDAWEPAAFSEANIQTSIEKELNATAEAAQASHAERTEPLDGLQRRVERYQELQTESEVEQLRAQQHEKPNKRATSFVWDAQSNTYFEQNSGYYYEPWRQLWYEPWNAIWYYHDTHRQVLVPCQQQTADNQTPNGQQQAQAQQPSESHQQEPEYSSQDRPQACSQRHAHATSVTSVRLSAHLPDFVKSLQKCRHNIIELSYRRSASERLRVQASARKGRIWVQALAKRNLSCTRSALTSIGQSLDSLRLVRYEAERGESNISNSESLDAVSLLNEKPVFGRSFIDEAPYGSKCNFLRLKSRDLLSAWTEFNELWSKHSSSSSRLFCG